MTMKNRLFKGLSILLLLMLAISTAAPALAAAKPSLPDMTMWEVWESIRHISLSDMNLPEDAELIKVTSSKKAVIEARIFDGNSLALWPGKAGKSKITVTYKIGDKKGTISRTYTVMKYPKPIATLKVDGKKINLTKNKAFAYMQKYKKTSTTIDVKLNKGWKIIGMEYAARDKNYDWVDDRSLKSLKKIKSDKNYNFEVRIRMINAKNQEYSYRIDFER